MNLTAVVGQADRFLFGGDTEFFFVKDNIFRSSKSVKFEVHHTSHIWTHLRDFAKGVLSKFPFGPIVHSKIRNTKSATRFEKGKMFLQMRTTHD